jgi:DICT domain-containing protein/signal transduction histidine kinase
MGMKSSRSLLQELLQTIPELKAQVYFKTTLTAISHAMEDLVLAGTDQPLVIANFQQERFYRQEAGRYQRIAQFTNQVYVLATPETDFLATPTPYATVSLAPADELAQEWHLIIVGQQYSACLVCREYAAPVDAIALDSARQFSGFWTFDPEISRQAATLLLKQIQSYRPDLVGSIQQAKQRYQLEASSQIAPSNLSPLELGAKLFSNRLVTYLQASQYRQVKAYQRVVEQERQERLVNRSTAAIRQSLQPEDVLSTTVQEISQLFRHCRCLLYRLPTTLPESLQHLSTQEYEISGAVLPNLTGKNWRLADHPLFQRTLSRGDMIAIADTAQDSGVQTHPELQQQLGQARIQACLLVPICYQQQCLAVLELHQARPYLWSVTDRDLLAAIAAQVGLVLIQAEAYVSLQQLNQQLVAVKQAQTNLIAIVGHELRTPLSTIQICLETLESTPEIPPDLQQTMLSTALTDSERLRKLIQDFLMLSRLECDLTTWQLEPVNLADAIAPAVTYLQAVGQPRDLPTIIVDIPTGLPPAIADGEALFQILSKLLDNACKYTPPAGTITVSVRTVDVTTQRQSQAMLEIAIADTGTGIEPNQLETIFERFYQEEGFLQRSVGGAGLGLAISRQLARQLGGRIWATSQGKGQGSQFHLLLPVWE